MVDINALHERFAIPEDERPLPKPTTAQRLLEYRDELLAAGFPEDQVAEMLYRAAAHPEGFETEADREREWRRLRAQMAASAFACALQMETQRERLGLADEQAALSPSHPRRRRWRWGR